MKRGVVDVDEATGLIKRLIEKPDPTTTAFRFASPAGVSLPLFAAVSLRLKPVAKCTPFGAMFASSWQATITSAALQIDR
jgi:hypothetical protein